MKLGKVFDVPGTQVVYTLRQSESGAPQVEMRTYVDGVHVAMSPGWENDDEGWQQATECLASRTQQTASDFFKQAAEIVRGES